MTEPDALARLLQHESGRALTVQGMPREPSQVVQAAPSVAGAQPVVRHLCRLWLEAGLSDREWGQALHMFETELLDQPRQSKAGDRDSDPREGRWTLETFSMWLLKRGKRLRECAQWFRAFDFDQDEMIGVGDFVQGLVAAGSPRTAAPGSTGGLCTAIALFRLLDVERKQALDLRELEGSLGDVQAVLGDAARGEYSLQQLAKGASDFEFFRSAVCPKLCGAPAFRLRVFGTGQATEP